MKEITLQRIKNLLERNFRDAGVSSIEYDDPFDQTSDPDTRAKKAEADISAWLVNEMKVRDEENNVLMWNKVEGLENILNAISQTLFDLLTDTSALNDVKTTTRGLRTRTQKADGTYTDALSGETYRTGGNRTAGSGNVWLEAPAGKITKLKVGNLAITLFDNPSGIKNLTIEMDSNPTTTDQLFIKVGSRTLKMDKDGVDIT